MRLAPLAALALLGGCIVYEKDIYHHGHGWGDDEGYSEDSGGAGDTAVAPETTFALSPNTISQGETRILSLSADPSFDFATVSEVQLYGDLTVCATEARPDELLITVSAAQDAATGPEDLLLVLPDGSVLYVADALTVTASGSTSEDGSDASSGCGA